MTSAPRVSAPAEPRKFPFGGVTGVDVDPMYAWLREHEPVSRIRLPFGEDAWLATRHADVKTVLTSSSFSRALASGRDVPRAILENFDGGIVSMDPPDHTMLRGLVSAPFTRNSVAQLTSRMGGIAARLADELARHSGPVDLAESFAVPLTLTVICEILGVPYADRAQFRRWTELGMADDADADSAIKLWQYHNDLIVKRRENPEGDLLSFVADEGMCQGYDDIELATLAMTVLVAGYLSAGTQLPTMAYVLLRDPALFHRVRSDPAIVPQAVDELIRWIPLDVNGSPPRYAVQDVVLSGTRISAGEPVIASTMAANRDPRVFTSPEELDFTRTHNPHLSFGAGPHYCLGAVLAKAELEIALSTLCSRFPHLRLATTEEEITWKSNPLVRGVEKLPVTW